MYKVDILPLANQDIKEAAKWYNERQSGLGKRFTNHVRQKVVHQPKPQSSGNSL